MPDAQKIVECTSVKYVPAHSWTLERNKIAKLCGEPECKREQVECELSNSESVAGEFITGSKDQMILLKEEMQKRACENINTGSFLFAQPGAGVTSLW